MKTLKEMFEYAKNIADTCEGSYVLFLTPKHKYLSDLFEYPINKQTSTYKGKGDIRFSNIPNSLNDAGRNFAGMKITHLFYVEYLPTEVYCFLKSKISRDKSLDEPAGIYNEWWVERCEDYSLSEDRN